MGSHEPFGHLTHKLWQKKGPGIKLAIWLPTTKSRKSIRLWCVQVEFNTPLKSSKKNLQLCFKPRPNRRSKQRVIASQSCGSPNRDNFGTPETKSHLVAGAAERCIEYYMGEGSGFPRVRAMVNLVSLELPMVCPSTKGARKSELTKFEWITKSLSLFLVPSWSFNTPLYPF
jgi:hypothetical protein